MIQLIQVSCQGNNSNFLFSFSCNILFFSIISMNNYVLDVLVLVNDNNPAWNSWNWVNDEIFIFGWTIPVTYFNNRNLN